MKKVNLDVITTRPQVNAIYFAQVNYFYGENIHLPYTSGVIAAAAFQDEVVREHFTIGGFLYRRENIAEFVRNMNVPPFMFAFSSYIWNHEYNKTLAKAIKTKFPECLIVFGGPHVPAANVDLMENNEYIDFLMFGEGEMDFKQLLKVLVTQDDINSVHNIAYRKDGKIRTTEACCYSDVDFPSPYLTGIFDDIIKNDKYNFSAVIETNRGCPFSCAYCDWGGESKARLKSFPMEKIYKEIEWFAQNKIEFIMGADANFGILKRDMEIVDELIKAKRSYGYPKKFRVNFTKNSNEAVLHMTLKLEENSLSKGTTLSFQTFNDEALTNIRRKNIPISQFSELMKLYNKYEISTYSELIIGLPGETTNSFKDAISQLLIAGQHSAINIYNCQLLPNSPMCDKAYLEKHRIRSTTIPQARIHCKIDTSEIEEYSDIIIGTYSMTPDEWVYMNIYAWVIQTFHCLGLTQKIAVFCFNEKRLNYSMFYSEFLAYIQSNESLYLHNVYKKIRDIISGALRGGPLRYMTKYSPDLVWSLEEGAFIDIVHNYETFCEEIYSFVSTIFTTKVLDNTMEEVLLYQQSILDTPNKDDIHGKRMKGYPNQNTHQAKIKESGACEQYLQHKLRVETG